MLVKKIIRNISNAFRIKKILQIMFFDIIRHASRQKSVGNLFIFNIFYFNYWLIAIIRFFTHQIQNERTFQECLPAKN